MTILRTLAFMISLASSALGHAQTQAQEERLSLLASYAIMSPSCVHVGATVAPDPRLRFFEAVKSETASWDVPRDVIEKRYEGAVVRHGKMLAIDLSAAGSQAKTDQQLRDLKRVFLNVANVCLAASRDRTTSAIVTLPADFNPDMAATTAIDSLIEIGGIASWQTKEITARGDIAMIAGSCRGVLGPSRSDALMAKYARADTTRERNYYIKAFETGLEDTESNFTLAQCERVIAANRKKIGY